MKPVDLIGSFEKCNFPSFRNPTIRVASCSTDDIDEY
jgi:hypothetical protein